MRAASSPRPSAEPGQVVAAGQGVVRIARIAEKEVAVAVPETLVARAQGGEAHVSLWSDPDRKFKAKLRELAPAADAATRTYLAKFSIPDATDEVKLGMTATLTLADPASERVARVPLSAIYNQGDGVSVFVTDGDGFVEAKAGRSSRRMRRAMPSSPAAWTTAPPSSRSACTSSTPGKRSASFPA